MAASLIMAILPGPAAQLVLRRGRPIVLELSSIDDGSSDAAQFAPPPRGMLAHERFDALSCCADFFLAGLFVNDRGQEGSRDGFASLILHGAIAAAAERIEFDLRYFAGSRNIRKGRNNRRSVCRGRLDQGKVRSDMAITGDEHGQADIAIEPQHAGAVGSVQ